MAVRRGSGGDVPLLRRARRAAKLGGSALRLAGRVARDLYERATSVERRAPAPVLPPRPPYGSPTSRAPSAQAATPPTAPSRPAPSTPSEDEPIRTTTLARLLAQQGHARRALAMYESLLAESPDDDALRAELEELQTSAGDDVEAEMVSLAVDERTVWVSWAVPEGGIARARRLLGEPGSLAVRLSVTAPDPSTIVRTEARELRDVEPSGEWTVRDLPDRSRATASVGVVGNGRFISIAHARAK